ncbi:single-stranded DNA-binding protein [Nanchangia anserum]|uniref:Single-stranded DNA-binding protein n=1 Tax=Nanchangia anserum TaxID=2692125 RepID=A0A8I0GGJ9_9ACTO|nr:R3H domain-containing nucleic acid-binding protein [Nanchangia anserum]MBD3689629.1 single-stranded DNA-binding protein [Nanchangia anserum]QOX81811.1 single-stranded DNA-binding protein [Nanchangia anserum]
MSENNEAVEKDVAAGEPFEDEAQAAAGDPVQAQQEAENAQAARTDDASPSQIELLEAQGDHAADYLEELLDIADLGGDLDIDVENDRAMVAIVAEGGDLHDLKRLVGRDGQVLESLQELTRLAVQQRTGERSRLMLDIANYRADKKRELTAIAEEAITKVKASGAPVKLAPMNPFERKVCHDVAAAAGCYSESEGTSPNRCVVIYAEDFAEDDE